MIIFSNASSLIFSLFFFFYLPFFFIIKGLFPKETKIIAVIELFIMWNDSCLCIVFLFSEEMKGKQVARIFVHWLFCFLQWLFHFPYLPKVVQGILSQQTSWFSAESVSLDSLIKVACIFLFLTGYLIQNNGQHKWLIC